MKTLTRVITGILVAAFLAGCTQWTVQVDLKPEDRAKYETQLKDKDAAIRNYKPVKKDDSAHAPLADYLDKGIAQQNLGMLGDALDTYQLARDIYPESRALHINMGRVYELAGVYDKAVEMYQYLVDHFDEPNYLYDITWVYIKTKDRKNAEKYFNAWQQAYHSTDPHTQDAIKKLRTEEKKA